MRTDITVKQTIELLNTLVEMDRKAISSCFSARQACNETISSHKDIQTAFNKSLEVSTLGILGILNFLFGSVPTGKFQGWGQIVALKDDNGQITKFAHIDELEELQKEQKK